MSESILSIKLKEYRIANSLTQQELAEILDVSDKSISKWELGHTYPSKKNVIKISELLGISIEILLIEEIVEDRQKENKLIRYIVPVLLVSIFIMTVLNLVNLKTIRNQAEEITEKSNEVQKQKKELDKLYNYTVTFVLAPKTPYTDFKEFIENYVNNLNNEIYVYNGEDHIVLSFNMGAHNNDEIEFIFQEIKREAPGLTNSEYHATP